MSGGGLSGLIALLVVALLAVCALVPREDREDDRRLSSRPSRWSALERFFEKWTVRFQTPDVGGRNLTSRPLSVVTFDDEVVPKRPSAACAARAKPRPQPTEGASGAVAVAAVPPAVPEAAVGTVEAEESAPTDPDGALPAPSWEVTHALSAVPLDVDDRCALIKGLVTIAPSGWRDILASAVEDPNEGVRRAALAALEHVALLKTGGP